MPLRDHFHLPWSEQNPWESFHSAWINTMVRQLNGNLLPKLYRAMPQVHLGQNIFEVRVHRDSQGMHLASVIELVSPQNKNRPEQRQAFIAKCAAYLQERVNVVVVDVVTSPTANLHREMMTRISQPSANGENAELIAVTYRPRSENDKWYLDIWLMPLKLEAALPTLPLWLSSDVCVPLDLEKSYEETCQVLRIGPT